MTTLNALLEMFLITYLIFLLYDFNVVLFLYLCRFLIRDLPLVLIILCYPFRIVKKHLELLYVLQTIIVWKEFELDTCFIFYLWNLWIFFYKCGVEINVLLKCEVLIM